MLGGPQSLAGIGATPYPFQLQAGQSSSMAPGLLGMMMLQEGSSGSKQDTLHSRHGRPTTSSMNPRKPKCSGPPRRGPATGRGRSVQHLGDTQRAGTGQGQSWDAANGWVLAGVALCCTAGVMYMYIRAKGWVLTRAAGLS